MTAQSDVYRDKGEITVPNSAYEADVNLISKSGKIRKVRKCGGRITVTIRSEGGIFLFRVR